MHRLFICTHNHNHHSGITDMVTMLRNGGLDSGFDTVVSDRIEPGHCNILIEHFLDVDWAKHLRALKRPGTRYVVICTEILSGDSFNQDLVPTGGHYGNNPYWSARYRGFVEVAAVADELWVLSRAAVADYQRAFPDKTVRWLRHGWVSDMEIVRHRPEDRKDIDFFFSGSITPDRTAILQRLGSRYRVAHSPQGGPDYLRRDLLARAKVCLAMPLSARNTSPSVSRLHFHLQNANFVVQQAYREPCELDPFVIHAPAEDFADWAAAALDIDNRRMIAEVVRERFRDEMPFAKWFGPMVRMVLDGARPEAGLEPAVFPASTGPARRPSQGLEVQRS
jgi:hypothetical protein